MSGVVAHDLSGLNWNHGGGFNETNGSVTGDTDYAIS